MPRVKIDTPGVSVELDADEVSVTELGRQAMDLYRKATRVNTNLRTGPAFGFVNDRRWTPDHRNGNARTSKGFEPVHANTEEQQ